MCTFSTSLVISNCIFHQNAGPEFLFAYSVTQFSKSFFFTWEFAVAADLYFPICL